jgi:hypothetical protein
MLTNIQICSAGAFDVWAASSSPMGGEGSISQLALTLKTISSAHRRYYKVSFVTPSPLKQRKRQPLIKKI